MVVLIRCIPATGLAGLSAVVPTGIVIAPVDAVPTNPDTAKLVAVATPNTGVTRVGDVLNTTATEPVEAVTPVPPEATGNALDSPLIVPPVIATLETVPPVIATLLAF